MFDKHYALTTWVMCFTAFVLNFLFYGGLYAFLQILPQNSAIAQGSNAFSSDFSMVAGVLGRFPGYLIGLKLGDVVGRKQGMQVYLLGVVLGATLFVAGVMGLRNYTELNLFGIFSFHVGTGTGNSGAAVHHEAFRLLAELSAIGGIVCYQLFVAAGVLLVYVYALEVYPTYCRNTGAALNL